MSDIQLASFTMRWIGLSSIFHPIIFSPPTTGLLFSAGGLKKSICLHLSHQVVHLSEKCGNLTVIRKAILKNTAREDGIPEALEGGSSVDG